MPAFHLSQVARTVQHLQVSVVLGWQSAETERLVDSILLGDGRANVVVVETCYTSKIPHEYLI